MLYSILKYPAKLALLFYCRNLSINKKEILKSKGPLLIAANHPNSFLDAVILATLFEKPVYALARGDVFVNRFVRFLLRSLRILPVYRISEGSENLNHNYHTFSECREIFKKNGVVLIFSEGLCVNEWKLRKLKKGTARLALSSWEEGIDLTILPVGINYHSFSSFGKNVKIQIGKSFNRNDLQIEMYNGNAIVAFNKRLESELNPLVDQINAEDTQMIKKIFFNDEDKKSIRPFLRIPGILGRIIHYPFYAPILFMVKHKAKKSVHFDSILTGILFFTYPILLGIVAMLVFYFFGGLYWLIPLIGMPFLAWAYIQTKKQYFGR